MAKDKAHIFLCRECGEKWFVKWQDYSPKEKVELAIDLVKTDFEWHRIFCKTHQHLKQINEFLGGLKLENQSAESN